MLRKVRSTWLAMLLVVTAGALPVRAGGGGSTQIGVIFADMDSGMIYRSSDDGATWQRTEHQPDSGMVQTIALGGHMVFVGTENGLFRSADGGDTWQLLYDAFVKGIAVDLVHPRLVYAVDNRGTFLRSTDGGTTWGKTYLPESETPLAGIVIDPARPSTLAVLFNTSNTTPKGEYDLLVSTDRGNVWHSVPGLPWDAYTPMRVGAVAYDPTTPLVAYAATQGGLYRSTDGGLSWHAGRMDQDLEAVVVDPSDPLHLVAGGLDSSYFSRDGGDHWAQSSRPIVGVGEMVVDVANPTTLVAAKAYSASPLQISYDGGNVWQTVPNPFPNPSADYVVCLASGWL